MCSACDAPEPRIPVLLVTGFLGSGKTTLLNHLLTTPAFARAAVVVNEYGETSIDHVLIAAPRRNVRVIDGGCLCGHVHEEVATALLDLADQRRAGTAQFDIAIIETSGLADPVPIVQILLTDAHVSTAFELLSVVTVADALHGAGHLVQHAESVKQAAVAETLVISKTDLADAAVVDALAGRLAAINPGARQFQVAHGRLDPTLLFERPGYALSDRSEDARRWLADASYTARTVPDSVDPAISTFTLDYKDEITRPGFVLWMNLLAGMRGAGLLRVKGIVNVEGRPYAVQAVQTIVSEPVPLEAWPDDDRRSRLVFITRGMNPDDVRRTLATFRFEGGRAVRNTTIDPATYARFSETMELFRRSSSRTPARGMPFNS